MSENPYQTEPYFHQLLQKCISAGARDLHLQVGKPPSARVGSDLVFFRLDELEEQHLRSVAGHLIFDESIFQQLETLHEYRGLYEVLGLGRFRVHLYRQNGSLALVLRIIPDKIRTFEELGAPPLCATIAQKKSGLIVVAGPCASGKTSSLAAYVHALNQSKSMHIVTLDDLIEYRHISRKCAISQRQVGRDTDSFATGLQSAMAQDCDMITVSDLRDGETLALALDAAESGHLVIVSLAVSNVTQSIRRLKALAQADRRGGVERLSHGLVAIIAQKLLPKVGGSGFALATEVLINTESTREEFCRAHMDQSAVEDLMTRSQETYGMVTFQASIAELESRGSISSAVARLAFA